MKKTNTRTIRRSTFSLALALAMLLSIVTMALPAMAANDSDIEVVWTAEGINKIITVTDREEDLTTVGPFTYVETNTAGTFRYTGTPATGITVEDLLGYAGVDTGALESDRVITFVAADSMRVSFTWGQLSEERYTYEYPGGTSGQAQLKQGVEKGAVPAIISFNQGSSAPRNFMGLTYPHEQFRGVMNQTIATIEIGGLAATWGAPYIFAESGSAETGTPLAKNAVVTAGDKIRITNNTHGQGGTSHKYMYTIGGSEPTIANADIFNWNSNGPSVSANPSIVVPADDGSGYFIVKAFTLGYGQLASAVETYAFKYDSDTPDWTPAKLPQSAPTGLTGAGPTSAGANGSINGTTTDMQYSADGLSWLDCASGSTSAAPGQYHVRYTETATHYAGASATVTVPQFSSSGGGPADPNTYVSVGGATPENYDFRVIGAVAKDIYFTFTGLLTYPGVTAHTQTKTFNHLNNVGTSGQATVKGINIEDLLGKAITLTGSAQSIKVLGGGPGMSTAAFERSFNFDANPLGIHWTDRDGNKLMLIWEENGNPLDSLRLAVGQKDETDVNRPHWVRDIHTIEVNARKVDPGEGTPAPYAPGNTTPGAPPPAAPGIPQTEAKASEPTAEQQTAADEAVKNAAETGAGAGISVESAGAAVAVSGGDSPALTTVSGVDAGDATVMAIVNKDGTLTPVPTKVNADGTVTVLISGDVVLVPLHVEAGFNDVAEHWGKDEINRAASLMIVEGVGGGDFNPAGEVTGAEAVTMFLRAIGIPPDADAGPAKDTDQEAWYAEIFNTAAANGLLGAGIDPDAPMTRLQTAELICNALETLGMKPDMDVDRAKEILADFTDLGHLTDEQLIYMGILVQFGIFKGNGDGTMNADGVLQRVHMASLAVRFQDLILSL
ncbi:MAG: S-layer homology domain-containing protein [Oscillospiraceae bacterium]|nr:S-layer homology domain-containing protein [Oscillospiraceae bacterium]